MAYENPFEIKTNSDGSYFGSYTDPKMAVSLISSTGGENELNLEGESSEVITDALSMMKDNPTGFNRNLNKRIKRADNIAQQTRLNIKLDKKENRQEKRAQKMLDKNPDYTPDRSSDPIIPELKSSIPAHNTTGSTLDVAFRGKPGTSNTSRGGGNKTPGSGKVVSKIGPQSNDPTAYSSQSVFGSGKRNMGFDGRNPLSGKQFHKAPKVKSSIHSRNSWGINKPNTEKYL